MVFLAGCRSPAPAPRAAIRPGVHVDAGSETRPSGNQHPAPITGVQARELIARGARLVDVRSPEEFAAGHLPGASNLPVELVWRRYAEIPPGLIVVYCASGTRSARARRILGAYGREAFDLGAMSNW